MKTILLIPPDGDPHKVFAPGAPVSEYSVQYTRRGGWVVTGASASSLNNGWLVGWETSGWGHVPERWPDGPSLALRLVWGGKVVPEACDRLCRILNLQPEVKIKPHLLTQYTVQDARRIGNQYVSHFGGQINFPDDLPEPDSSVYAVGVDWAAGPDHSVLTVAVRHPPTLDLSPEQVSRLVLNQSLTLSDGTVVRVIEQVTRANPDEK